MSDAAPAILAPSRNCWRVGRAPRFAFIVDAAAYYAALAEAFERAERSILVIGWAIDSRVPLRRGDVASELPRELGAMLDALVKRRRDLHVKVLAWDIALVFGLERGFVPLYRDDHGWRRRLRWELDGEHRLGAAQHEKIVIVDERVAFVGGIDVTGQRWDTPAHRPADPLRVEADGPYGAWHDVACAFDGEAAALVAEHAARRWKRATGGRLMRVAERARNELKRAQAEWARARAGLWRKPPPNAPPLPADPWPPSLEPQMRDVSVGLARTLSAYLDQPDVREIERLWLDAIAAARRHVYIESQYFTSQSVVGAIEARLGEPEGPEIVIVQPRACAGWLEQRTMGAYRDHHFRKLKAADAGGRLRVVYPVADGGEDVYLHSKVLVVDDRLARVGASNISNRAMTLDTELDAAVEWEGDETKARAIASFRDGLVGEHLGVDAETVARLVAEHGSLVRAIDELRETRPEGARTLLPLPEGKASTLIPASWADPERVQPVEDVESTLVPGTRKQRQPRRRDLVRFVALIGTLDLMALIWTLSPMGIPGGATRIAEWIAPWADRPLAPLIAFAMIVVAGVIWFPISILVLACALAFGPITGSLIAIGGTFTSAVLGYITGRALGRHSVRLLAGPRVNRISRQLASHGVLAIAAARLLPFVPFSHVSITAGATHVRPLDYVVGSLLGTLPGILTCALLAHVIVQQPGIGLVVELALFTALLVGGLVFVRARLRGPEG